MIIISKTPRKVLAILVLATKQVWEGTLLSLSTMCLDLMKMPGKMNGT